MNALDNYTDDQIEVMHWQTKIPQSVVTDVVKTVSPKMPKIGIDTPKGSAISDFKFMADGEPIGPRSYGLIKKYIEETLDRYENDRRHDDLFDEKRQMTAYIKSYHIAMFLRQLDQIWDN